MTSHDMGRRTCDVMWHSLRTCHATCVMTQGGSGVAAIVTKTGHGLMSPLLPLEHLLTMSVL